MRIYIVRHGKATDAPEPTKRFPRPEGYGPDFDRPLTTRGEAQARFLAEYIRGAEQRPELILTSRYPRACQTAETIHGMWQKAALETAPELEVDHPVSEALGLIDRHRGAQAIMLVGHNPQLGELLSVLCAGLPPEQLVLKTGELIVVDIRPAQAVGSGKVIARLRLGDEPPVSARAGLTKTIDGSRQHV